MPKLKGETDQQWMDRIRSHRGLPPMERDDLFTNLRAAQCYVGSVANPERAKDIELIAFMHFFHPRPEGYTLNDVRKMRR